MGKHRLLRALEFRDNPLSQLLAQLDTPLVERVDAPHRALGKDAVLVDSDEFTQGFWGEPLGEDRVRRAVALEDPVGTSQPGVPSALTCFGVLPKASASVCANTFA